LVSCAFWLITASFRCRRSKTWPGKPLGFRATTDAGQVRAAADHPLTVVPAARDVKLAGSGGGGAQRQADGEDRATLRAVGGVNVTVV
jgi:hypothetical protein